MSSCTVYIAYSFTQTTCLYFCSAVLNMSLNGFTHHNGSVGISELDNGILVVDWKRGRRDQALGQRQGDRGHVTFPDRRKQAKLTFSVCGPERNVLIWSNGAYWFSSLIGIWRQVSDLDQPDIEIVEKRNGALIVLMSGCLVGIGTRKGSTGEVTFVHSSTYTFRIYEWGGLLKWSDDTQWKFVDLPMNHPDGFHPGGSNHDACLQMPEASPEELSVVPTREELLYVADEGSAPAWTVL